MKGRGREERQEGVREYVSDIRGERESGRGELREGKKESMTGREK